MGVEAVLRKRMTLTKGDGVTFKEGYERFIQEKWAMNSSPDTIDYYDMCYRYFTGFMSEDTLCRDIGDDIVIKYILHLRETRPEMGDITLNTYLRGVRAIFYSLMDKGYVSPFKIGMVRAEKKIKETYTDEELDRLLKKPDLKKDNFSTYRNWVIVCYLLGTGNRSRTVCNLKISDIDFFSHEIKLKKVKNKRQYIIPSQKRWKRRCANIWNIGKASRTIIYSALLTASSYPRRRWAAPSTAITKVGA